MFKTLYTGLVNLMLLTACSDLPAKTENRFPSVEGKLWKLISFENDKTPVTGKATLFLENGKYTGWSGCNRMIGTYIVEEDRISFDPTHSAVSTMMACANMAMENSFHKALRKTDHYKIKGGNLLLLSRGENVLRFREKDNSSSHAK